MNEPNRGWHTPYYLMGGTEFKLPQASWRVYDGVDSSTDKLYGTSGHRGEGKLPAPITLASRSLASGLFEMFPAIKPGISVSPAFGVIMAILAGAMICAISVRCGVSSHC